AEPMLRESLSLVSRAYPQADWRPAQAQVRLGACLMALERFSEGDNLLDSGLAAFEAAVGSDDDRLRQSRELAAAARDRS
ncbi:MAG: hypothetical protein AAF560_28045, partial [Acidobacteriota bacterium]